MRMATSSPIERDLEELRKLLSDPFDLPVELEVLFSRPIARELLAGGSETVRSIVGLLESNANPALNRVAVLVLSRFAPPTFYRQLLVILGKADQSMAEAMEPGMWSIGLPEQQIAQDLVELVASSANPYPLLLLQRPVAKAVRSQLAGFIRQRRMPLSLYALYCVRYALEPEDAPLMKAASTWVETPEMSALAGLYLLKLGSKYGLPGIRAGLMAPDEHVRALTYAELAGYLPHALVEHSGYDPVKSGAGQLAAADALLAHL